VPRSMSGLVFLQQQDVEQWCEHSFIPFCRYDNAESGMEHCVHVLHEVGKWNPCMIGNDINVCHRRNNMPSGWQHVDWLLKAGLWPTVRMTQKWNRS
jgi:hypothetical protein